jgi:hypothetical protein
LSEGAHGKCNICTIHPKRQQKDALTKIMDYFDQPHPQASPAHSKQPQAYVEHASDHDDDEIELLEEGLAPVTVQWHREE